MSDLSASSRGGVVDFVFEIPEYGNPPLSFSAAQNKKHISPPPQPMMLPNFYVVIFQLICIN